MLPRKKILILGKLPPPFMGPAIATEILLNSSLKERFELLHLDTRLNTSLDTMGKWKLGKVWKNASLLFRLFSLCSRQRPNLVLIPISQSTTGFLKDAGFVMACKLAGCKVLLQLRGSNFQNWLHGAPRYMHGVVRRAMKRSEGIIVLGQKLRYLFKDYFPGDRIFVIPNGGDFTFPVVSKEGPVRFLFFSNLFEAKGITDVIEAVRLLAADGTTGFKLDVAGKWLEEKTRMHCEEIVKKNNLPVTFYPPLSGKEKLERFSRADVFLFPPREPEGHPWVIVEAMAAALPVIATDKGAIAESVIDKENGFVIPDKSPDVLCQKMKALMGPDLRKQMGDKSLAMYKRQFTESAMVSGYVACFDALTRTA